MTAGCPDSCDVLAPPPPHHRGWLPCCAECGSAGRTTGGRPAMRLHVPTGRVLCGRCIERGIHLLPPPPERPVLLSDLIR